MEKKLEQILQIVTGMQKEIISMKEEITSIKEEITSMKKEITSIKEDLERLNNVVTLMEDSHGKKLQVLLDQQPDCMKRHDDIKSTFDTIDDTLSRHDARLYVLEHAN